MCFVLPGVLRRRYQKSIGIKSNVPLGGMQQIFVK